MNCAQHTFLRGKLFSKKIALHISAIGISLIQQRFLLLSQRHFYPDFSFTTRCQSDQASIQLFQQEICIMGIGVAIRIQVGMRWTSSLLIRPSPLKSQPVKSSAGTNSTPSTSHVTLA